MIDLTALIAQARASGSYDRILEAVPYARWLGLRAALSEGAVRVHMAHRPLLIGNPILPALHGGTVGACLETAALLQLVHVAGGPHLPRTIDFTVDYLRAAKAADLFADAEVQRVGRRIANVRMRAWQENVAEPVALGRGNFLVD